MKVKRLNIFSEESLLAADAVGVTTNGIIKRNGAAVMGAGVALAARRRFPAIDFALARSLARVGNHVSTIWVSASRESHLCSIFSFPTKEHWRNPSTLSLIGHSAQELAALASRNSWKTVYLPRPGCANGGLDWADVEPILDRHLDKRFTVVHL